MRARLLFLSCMLLTLPLGANASAQNAEEDRKDVAEAREVQVETSPTVQLELWVVTLSPDATDEVEAKINSPVNDREAVLSRIRELEKQELVTRSQYLMASALEGEQAFLRLEAKEPRIQGVSMTKFGRQASAKYESLGTTFQAKSRLTSSHAVIDFMYEDSYLAPTGVVIFEPTEGNGENVELDQTRQFTLRTTVSCPKHGAVTVMASGGRKNSDQPATIMFLAVRTVE